MKNIFFWDFMRMERFISIVIINLLGIILMKTPKHVKNALQTVFPVLMTHIVNNVKMETFFLFLIIHAFTVI